MTRDEILRDINLFFIQEPNKVIFNDLINKVQVLKQTLIYLIFKSHYINTHTHTTHNRTNLKTHSLNL